MANESTLETGMEMSSARTASSSSDRPHNVRHRCAHPSSDDDATRRYSTLSTAARQLLQTSVNGIANSTASSVCTAVWVGSPLRGRMAMSDWAIDAIARAGSVRSTTGGGGGAMS